LELCNTKIQNLANTDKPARRV